MLLQTKIILGLMLAALTGVSLWSWNAGKESTAVYYKKQETISAQKLTLAYKDMELDANRRHLSALDRIIKRHEKALAAEKRLIKQSNSVEVTRDRIIADDKGLDRPLSAELRCALIIMYEDYYPEQAVAGARDHCERTGRPPELGEGTGDPSPPSDAEVGKGS